MMLLQPVFYLSCLLYVELASFPKLRELAARYSVRNHVHTLVSPVCMTFEIGGRRGMQQYLSAYVLKYLPRYLGYLVGI